MNASRETIAVKGEKDRAGRAARSRGTARCCSRTRSGNRAFALKWVGSEPGGAAYLASLVGRPGDEQGRVPRRPSAGGRCRG